MSLIKLRKVDTDADSMSSVAIAVFLVVITQHGMIPARIFVAGTAPHLTSRVPDEDAENPRLDTYFAISSRRCGLILVRRRGGEIVSMHQRMRSQAQWASQQHHRYSRWICLYPDSKAPAKVGVARLWWYENSAVFWILRSQLIDVRVAEAVNRKIFRPASIRLSYHRGTS